MHLPAPRGPLSAHLVDVLAGEVVLDATTVAAARAAAGTSAPLTDDDLHLSLWMLYELHYRGFDGVDDGWEWEPQLLAVRRELETVYERALRTACRKAVDAGVAAAGPDADLPEQLFGLVSSFDGPSLAKHLHREATAEQFKEVLVHRSIYQLKEADPHTWTIPRLPDGPKVALVELQYDEYGAGRAHRQHAHLFAEGMAACGLDRTYGAYVDAVPGLTLALSNAMSLFGLHRRLRGASVGHLAALEATSSLPCKKYVGASAGSTCPRRSRSTSTSTSRPTRCTSRSRSGTSAGPSSSSSRSSARRSVRRRGVPAHRLPAGRARAHELAARPRVPAAAPADRGRRVRGPPAASRSVRAR